MTKTLSAALCVVLGALLTGCSEQPAAPTRPQGLQPGEELARTPPSPLKVQPAPVPPPPPRSSLESPFASRDPGSLSKPQQQVPVAAAATQDAGARPQSAASQPALADDPTKPRDLPGELIAILGRPADCLDLAAIAAAGGRTTLSITASVMPSGRVIRATADAPNQSADALRCLEQKLSAGSFRAPVPAAPRDVTATIPIEVVAQP